MTRRTTSRTRRHDVKNQIKDAAHDVKNDVKDAAHDAKNEVKDAAAQDAKN